MEMLGQQTAIVIGILAVCFVEPALAVRFLFLRNLRARARRRSPIGIALLRGPGHTLREQLDDAVADITSDVFPLMLMPLLLLCIFLAQGHWRGFQGMMHLAPIGAVAGAGFVAFMVRKMLKAGGRLANLKAGFDAELVVGQELDQLTHQGAVAFHDIPAEAFNIDHVAISRVGAFAVETKGFTKPKQGRGKADAAVVFDGEVLKFPTWATKVPLEQAERQAAWLTQWLTSATGFSVHVLPVLALPGWFVERTGRGSVRVFSGKQLAGLLRSRGAQALSAQDVQRITHQIEQRCRTVAPRYAEAGKAS